MMHIGQRISLLLTGFLCVASTGVFAQATIVQYLSGTDKDHTVPWDFYCTKGRKSGQWDKIAVPSNWEQQGFGTGYIQQVANAKGKLSLSGGPVLAGVKQTLRQFRHYAAGAAHVVEAE